MRSFLTITLILIPAFCLAESRRNKNDEEVFQERLYDEVILNNNTSFHGTIEREDDNQVVLKMKDSPLEHKFNKGGEPENIKNIIYKFTRRDSYLKELEPVGDDVEKNYRLGLKCKRSGLDEEYEVQMKRVTELNPHHLKAYENLLAYYKEKGDLERELETCLKMREENLQPVPMVQRLGEIYMALGLHAWAVREFQLVLGTDAGHERALIRCAEVYRRMGNMVESLQLFDRALRVKPKQWEAMDGKGRVAFEGGRMDQARLHFEKAIVANPQYAPARLHMAFVHLAAAEPSQALEQLRQVPEDSAKDWLIVANTALAEAAIGNTAKAEELLKGIEEHLDEPAAKLIKAFTYEHLAEEDSAGRAMTVYQQIIETHPEVFFAQLGLVRSLHADAKSDLALDMLPRVIRMRLEFWATHLTHGLIHLSKEDYASTVQHLQKARELRAQAGIAPDTDLLFGLGWALLGAGNAADARGLFSDALQADPDFEPAQKALAYLATGASELPKEPVVEVDGEAATGEGAGDAMAEGGAQTMDAGAGGTQMGSETMTGSGETMTGSTMTEGNAGTNANEMDGGGTMSTAQAATGDDSDVKMDKEALEEKRRIDTRALEKLEGKGALFAEDVKDDEEETPTSNPEDGGAGTEAGEEEIDPLDAVATEEKGEVFRQASAEVVERLDRKAKQVIWVTDF